MTRPVPLLALILLVSLLVPPLVVVSGGPAAACSCAMAGPRALLARSSDAFTGVVQQVHGADDEGVTELRVDRVWKGGATEVTGVAHGTMESACGWNPAPGERWVVFAYREGGELSTSLCSTRSGQREVDRAVAVLGAGAAPGPGTTEAGTVDDGLPIVPLALGGVLLGAVGALLVVRRLRR